MSAPNKPNKPSKKIRNGIQIVTETEVTPDVSVFLGTSGDCSWVWVTRNGNTRGGFERFWDAADAKRAFRFHVENAKKA